MSLLEWCEYGMYGYFAPIIGKLFFPSDNEMVSLLASFGVFFIGFLPRPLGSIVFGTIGDKKGRKFALLLSLSCMTIPTVIMGFLPTYIQIGIFATIVLIMVRLLQGFAIGGQYGGVFIFIIEHAPKEKRGFYGSWSTFGVIGGLLLGSGIAALITSLSTELFLETWGWRIPYIASSLIIFLIIYMKKNVPETPEFDLMEKLKLKRKTPILDVFKNYKLKLVQGTAIIVLDAVAIYTMFVFFNNYMHQFHHLPLSTALTINTINMVILVAFIPIFGYLSDKLGRKFVLLFVAIGYIVCAYPSFLLLQTQNIILIFIGQLAFAILMGACYGVIPAAIVELFPKEIRYSACSFVCNVCTTLFGGSMPFILSLLIDQTNNVMVPAYVLIVTGLITIPAILSIQFAKK